MWKMQISHILLLACVIWMSRAALLLPHNLRSKSKPFPFFNVTRFLLSPLIEQATQNNDVCYHNPEK